MGPDGRGGLRTDAWDLIEGWELAVGTAGGDQGLSAEWAEAVDGHELTHGAAREQLVSRSRCADAPRDWGGSQREETGGDEEESDENPGGGAVRVHI